MTSSASSRYLAMGEMQDNIDRKYKIVRLSAPLMCENCPDEKAIFEKYGKYYCNPCYREIVRKEWRTR